VDVVPTVAVVGAGITGLATAWRLQRTAPGVRVLVLEQAARHGGALLAQALDVEGTVRADVGAEAMLARRPEAIALAEEVGLGEDLLHPATTRAAIYSRGSLHPMPRGTVMGVPGDPQALRGLLTEQEVARVAAEPALPAAPVTADVDVAGFVAGRMGAAVVERLVEPLLGGVYAGRADHLSLKATVPALWPAAMRGGSLLEEVRRQVGGSGTAVGSGSGAPVFAGIRGGVARLADRLRERLQERGVQVRTRACVQALRPDAGGWQLELGPAGRGAVLRADAVVLALPAGRAGRLLTGVAPQAAVELAGIRTASLAIGSFVVPASVLDGLHVSGFLVPPAEGRLVKAATFSSLKWEWLTATASGKAVVRVSIGRAGEERALQLPDAELLRAAAADLEDLLDRPVPVDSSVLTRWGGALPQYEVGHVERVERIRAAIAEQPRLAVAGASYDGVGIPACIVSADAAASAVLAALG
jgi:protoporphyrinogen/coproporphyrinogen III oxidase